MTEATDFLGKLERRAATRPRRIGFPELDDARTRKAVLDLHERGLVLPVAVGTGDELAEILSVRPDLEHVDTSEPGEAADGTAPKGCEGSDPLQLGASLLRQGRLDGVVAGANSSTADVIRVGLRCVGKRPDAKTVSSAFYMVLREPTPAGERVLTFADAAVVPDPSSEQLAELAVQTCRARRVIVGDEPRVAFLSYATHGSADGDAIKPVREAVRLFSELCPEIPADGELQADAALVPDIAAMKAPGSPIAGAANVLIFPDLNSGNIAYNLVQRLAGAKSVGPIIQGLARPLNDLSRGASMSDIVHVACITALMAEDSEPPETGD